MSAPGPRRTRGVLVLLLVLAAPAWAGRITLQVEGVDGRLRDAVLESVEVAQYAEREVSAHAGDVAVNRTVSASIREHRAMTSLLYADSEQRMGIHAGDPTPNLRHPAGSV